MNLTGDCCLFLLSTAWFCINAYLNWTSSHLIENYNRSHPSARQNLNTFNTIIIACSLFCPVWCRHTFSEWPISNMCMRLHLLNISNQLCEKSICSYAIVVIHFMESSVVTLAMHYKCDYSHGYQNQREINSVAGWWDKHARKALKSINVSDKNGNLHFRTVKMNL